MSGGAASSLAELVAGRYGWSAPIRLPQLWEPLCDPDDRVTFGMVVSARECTWDSDLQAEALAVGRLLRERFEQQQGEIQNSYFCRYTRGGCAVTERVEGTGRRQRVIRRLHSVLNSSASQLVSMETGCVVLADDAAAAFAQQPGAVAHLRAATDRIYSVMTRVLAAADVWARESSTTDERASAVEAAAAGYAVVSRNVNAAIQRQARFMYFQGVLAGAVLAIAVCGAVGVLAAYRWSHVVSPAALVAATVFGALGALASVFQRTASGQLVLDFSASRGQLVTLGGLRPFVGALFGAVIQFILVTSVFGTASPGRSAQAAFAAFALAGFVAGFSERFATDMIERAGSVIAGTTGSPPDTPGDARVARPAGPQSPMAPPEPPVAAPQSPVAAPQSPGPGPQSPGPQPPGPAPQPAPASTPVTG